MANDWSLLFHPVQQNKPRKTTMLPHEDHQSGCSLRDRQSLRKNIRVPIRKLHQEASEDNIVSEIERFRNHRLSSRGAYLWETPNRGRFTTLSDGGRLFIIFFEYSRGSCSPKARSASSFLEPEVWRTLRRDSSCEPSTSAQRLCIWR